MKYEAAVFDVFRFALFAVRTFCRWSPMAYDDERKTEETGSKGAPTYRD